MSAQLGRELETDQFDEVLIERVHQSEDDCLNHLLRIRHQQFVVDFHAKSPWNVAGYPTGSSLHRS